MSHVARDLLPFMLAIFDVSRKTVLVRIGFRYVTVKFAVTLADWNARAVFPRVTLISKSTLIPSSMKNAIIPPWTILGNPLNMSPTVMNVSTSVIICPGSSAVVELGARKTLSIYFTPRSSMRVRPSSWSWTCVTTFRVGGRNGIASEPERNSAVHGRELKKAYESSYRFGVVFGAVTSRRGQRRRGFARVYMILEGCKRYVLVRQRDVGTRHQSIC